jgi:hypothetical protein
MKAQIEESILNASGAKRIIETTLIQELWSGYGKILRCKLEGSSFTSVVVKHVQLPTSANHPKGWNTNISHDRKHKSYQVEINWYTGLANQCNENCRIPELYHSQDNGEELLMILEDLNESGYPKRKSIVKQSEIEICLSWLANFHAQYMQVQDESLWDVGSYWHLATRPDELEAMLDKELQEAAPQIDLVLNAAKNQTVIHGDAKLANFCFSNDGKKVSAVDFQYVGHGCGMKDVAYFLSSCLEADELYQSETTLLDFYFDALDLSLHKLGREADFQAIKEEWTMLYPYAWTDFYRFLDGWSPEHWKMNAYSEALKNKVLKSLK